MTDRPHSTLWWASVAHFLNDGLAASLTPLLPLMAEDLSLSYSQAGAVKAALNGVTSLSQLPAGFLATHASESTFLGLGLGWFSLSFLLVGLAGGYLSLLLLMASAGVGGGVYHPVGTAWVSRIFLSGGRGAAVGTLNFAGDVGKVLLPALAGVLIVWIGWRGSLSVLGAAGAATAVVLILRDWLQRGETRSARVRMAGRATNWGIARPGQFALIGAIGFIDQAGRSGVMAFLGFLLLAKGLPETSLGWLVAITFAGGALGKFGCGLLTDRFEDRRVMGVTEATMATGCLLLGLTNPGLLLVPLLLIFGLALNGTSSVIYTRLADTLQPDNFSRGYGLYYTLSFASSAVSPVLYGLLADFQGLTWVYVSIAAMNLCILPLLTLLEGTTGTAKRGA
jgi:FSR family fosmidomycin resistance protein-like MFS transporter